MPSGFTATDLSFVGTSDGWALGTAPCANKPCTSVLRTSDGGEHWVGIPAPVIALGASGSTQPGVSGIRFGSPNDGYVFGGQDLYATTDGGTHWMKESGGAVALEPGAGNVLRVQASQSGACPPGCTFNTYKAAVGSGSWTKTSAPSVDADFVQLARSGSLAAGLYEQNPAGGAESAHSTILISSDAGTDWHEQGDPCGRHNGTEYDASLITAGSSHDLAVVCDPRGADGVRPMLLTSTDSGANWLQQVTLPVGNDPDGLVQEGGTLLVTVASGVNTKKVTVFRHVSGDTFDAEATFAASTSHEPYFGFETESVGKLLTTPGALHVTTDGGQRWSTYAFNG